MNCEKKDWFAWTRKDGYFKLIRGTKVLDPLDEKPIAWEKTWASVQIMLSSFNYSSKHLRMTSDRAFIEHNDGKIIFDVNPDFYKNYFAMFFYRSSKLLGPKLCTRKDKKMTIKYVWPPSNKILKHSNAYQRTQWHQKSLWIQLLWKILMRLNFYLKTKWVHKFVMLQFKNRDMSFIISQRINKTSGIYLATIQHDAQFFLCAPETKT